MLGLQWSEAYTSTNTDGKCQDATLTKGFSLDPTGPLDYDNTEVKKP